MTDYKELITQLRENNPEDGIYAEVNTAMLDKAANALEAQAAEIEAAQVPDCRTCVYYAAMEGCFNCTGCTNGDKYEPAPKLVLWRDSNVP